MNALKPQVPPQGFNMKPHSTMLLCLLLALSGAHAQSVQPNHWAVPSDVDAAAGAKRAELLGAVPVVSSGTPRTLSAVTSRTEQVTPLRPGALAAQPTAAGAPASPAAKKTAGRTSNVPTPLADMPPGLGFEGAANGQDVERVVFDRAPIRVVLPINRERLITFAGPVAFHAPEGFETLVQSQIIDRTAYLKALAPLSRGAGDGNTVRVVAEDLNTGRQIPLDLVLDVHALRSLRPVEVMFASQAAAALEEGAANRATARSEPALDIVALTRYAAQMLYAPRRLSPATAGVKQLPIAAIPIEGLYRGWRVQTTPIGAWRSGQLYVTAVRFTNQGQEAIDIDLQELRGQWVAATAQHTRLLGGANNDWNTTTVYLVCDRPFEACR
jgi:integrating conjugative element protein (TIGR03749 family)